MTEKIVIEKHDKGTNVMIDASVATVIFMIGKALDNASDVIEERLDIPKEVAVKAACEFALADKGEQNEITLIADMMNILYKAGDKEALKDFKNILNRFGDEEKNDY